jgi:hypothetical protein
LSRILGTPASLLWLSGILGTPASLLLLLSPGVLGGSGGLSGILSAPAGLLLRIAPASLLLSGVLSAPTGLLLAPLIISSHTCSLRIPLTGPLLTGLPAGGTGGIILVIFFLFTTATEKHECHPQNNGRYNQCRNRYYIRILVKRCWR